MEMKKSDGCHIILMLLNSFAFLFWVEFLIRQYILEVTFSFNLDLCSDSRPPIAQL